MLKAAGHFAKIEIKVPKNERTECDPSQFGRIILLFWNFFYFFKTFFTFFEIFLILFFTIFQL